MEKPLSLIIFPSLFYSLVSSPFPTTKPETFILYMVLNLQELGECIRVPNLLNKLANFSKEFSKLIPSEGI